MALIDVVTGRVGPTCTGGGSHNWIDAQFRIMVDYNSTKTAYAISVYGCINSRGEMHWSGDAALVATCNGKTSRVPVNYRMYSSYPEGSGLGGWDGPATFEFGAPGDLSLNFKLTIDLTPTTGDNGRPGVYHRSDGGNITAFTLSSYSIDVSAIPLGKKPELASIVNNNKYKNPATGVQDLVSASTNSIAIKANVTDWGEPTATLEWSCGNKSGSTSSSTFTVTGLSAGTSYTIKVYLTNSIGNSETKSITIRTRHNIPVVTISLSDVDLEQLIFNWTSDKELKSTEYKIDNNSWVSLGQTGKSGTFTAQWFDPKTTHTIYFRGTSTNALDALLSNEKNASGTTHDRAHITNIGDCIFGLTISIDIESESDKQLKMEIWTEGNDLTPLFTFDNIGVGNRTWIFDPTQDQLDQMYRCYPYENNIPIKFLLTTHGEWKDWEDDQQDRTLILTGIAKTAHIGDESNKPRRCQVWVGDESNKPRRVVCWVGDESRKARRTI